MYHVVCEAAPSVSSNITLDNEFFSFESNKMSVGCRCVALAQTNVTINKVLLTKYRELELNRLDIISL